MNVSRWIIVTLLLAGCATSHPAREGRLINEGYSLLYQLLSQESDAAKLLIIKRADPPIADLIQVIAASCEQARRELESWRAQDPRLDLQSTGLPALELKTRGAIESTVTKQLLFSSGQRFEVRFLFTQAEAMNYAAHLARVLHDQESDVTRQKFLMALALRCTALHDRALEMLKY